MRRFRFSIAGLLALVAAAAVGVFAMREGSPAWDAAVFTATLALLAGGVLRAVHRPREARAFWVGFVLLGGLHLAAMNVGETRSRLLTAGAVDRLAALAPGEKDGEFAPDELFANPVRLSPLFVGDEDRIVAWQGTDGRAILLRNPPSPQTMSIGDSLMSLVVGLLGGAASRAMHRGDGDRRPPGRPET